MMRFRARIELSGKTATGVIVPAEVVQALGGGKRPKVQVTINGHTYPSSVVQVSGRYMFPVSAEVRGAAAVAAGDVVEVDLVLDTSPRTVTVPDDLAAALDAAPGARQAFQALSYTNQKRHVLAVEGAKATETRQRRIAKVIDELTS